MTVSRKRDPVLQFSVFAPNKVGQLNELVQHLAKEDLHIMAMCMLDTTECTIMRLILDYPDQARSAFERADYAYAVSEVIAVEVPTEAQVKYITTALVEAEINIHYIYPFVARPEGRSALALHLEDNELAATVLGRRGLRVLGQSDIAR